jgi:hypothetical protein
LLGVLIVRLAAWISLFAALVAVILHHGMRHIEAITIIIIVQIVMKLCNGVAIVGNVFQIVSL